MTAQSPTPLPGIELVDLGIYLPRHHTLILADLHIGYEESLVKQGILIPKFHFRDLVKSIEGILSTLKRQKKTIRHVIINGDLKHEFGSISDEEWRNTIKVIDLLSRNCEKVIITRGNHDSILGPIADKKKVEFVNHILLDDILICHGNEMPDIPPSIKTVITAHEHPAVTLHDGLREERYKAYLIGRYQRHNLIVQPAMNPLSSGSDPSESPPLSRFLKPPTRIRTFDVYIVADKVYEFGKLGRLKSKA